MAKQKTQSHKGARQVKRDSFEATSASKDRLTPYRRGSDPWKPEGTTYHITKEGDQWVVKREGAKRASRILVTKKEAIEKARSFAKKRPSGHIILHKEDGSIQEEYPNSGDVPPSRPKKGEPYSFLHFARSLNLDGPEDWSERIDDYLYGDLRHD